MNWATFAALYINQEASRRHQFLLGMFKDRAVAKPLSSARLSDQPKQHRKFNVLDIVRGDISATRKKHQQPCIITVPDFIVEVSAEYENVCNNPQRLPYYEALAEKKAANRDAALVCDQSNRSRPSLPSLGVSSGSVGSSALRPYQPHTGGWLIDVRSIVNYRVELQFDIRRLFRPCCCDFERACCQVGDP